MDGRILRISARMGLLVLWLLLGGCGSSADGAGCTAATLKGSYVYAYDGFQVMGETAAQRIPFAFAGRDIWHGDGTMAGTGSGGTNGVPDGVASYTGTYSLDADCTGSLIYTDGSGHATHWDLYVLNNGALISYVQTDAGFVAAGTEQRQ
ncbi:MAG: hypothetical protein SF182_04565 [Deltaproteobacteria bacterium]|nr:hypothetical protein [Deltaproteobacteria bacterium]